MELTEPLSHKTQNDFKPGPYVSNQKRINKRTDKNKQIVINSNKQDLTYMGQT